MKEAPGCSIVESSVANGHAQRIDDGALLAQAASVTADPQTLKAEKTLTHPLLLRRIDRLQRR